MIVGNVLQTDPQAVADLTVPRALQPVSPARPITPDDQQQVPQQVRDNPPPPPPESGRGTLLDLSA